MTMLDQNQNQNQGIGSAVERRFRARYNTDIFARLVDTTPPSRKLVPPVLVGGPPNYPLFHENWDADLRASMHLDDFLAKLIGASASAVAAAAAGAGGATAATVSAAVANAANTPNAAALTWRTTYANVARNGGANKPPHEMNQDELGDEVLRMLELGLEREDRVAEIIDQDDGDGAINYWLGMLKIDPARHPATYLMAHIGRRIGEHVVMCLKGDFRSPRPPQLCPAITPMIDPPVTPSFPAGHALQSYLMSYLLAYSLSDAAGVTKLPQHTLPAPNSALAVFLAPATCPKGPLFDLANRVSENRIVAGIHYPTDIRAGQAVAVQTFKDIQAVASIWQVLRAQVRAEFPQYAA
jgi:membrane-associated phospholipid phosphatase